MSEVPSELKYTASHEWLRVEDDGLVTVGVSDHAQELLGDLVFVELPEAGTDFVAGDECCVVESVKAASDVYMPISGEIVEIQPYPDFCFKVVAGFVEIQKDDCLEDILASINSWQNMRYEFRVC